MKILLIFSVLLSLGIAKADNDELNNFHAGKYNLAEGDRARCGQGNFWIFDETKYLMLDSLHGFSIKANTSVEPSDIPGEENCKYYGKNDVKIGIDKTELTMTSVFKCKDKVRYTLVKRALITNRKITMQVQQVGEGATKYSCDWNRQ